VAYLPLEPCPPPLFDLRKVSHMAKNATFESCLNYFALKFIKYYLRSTMTDERLNGLALLFVHLR